MIEVAVTLALAGLEPAEHFLYLAPFSDRRDGAETVADYLNGRRRFFPMVASGVPKMINRDQILWVRYEKLPDVVELEMTIVEKLTIVELTDGTRIEGVIPIDRPREQSRISDVLNDASELFVRIDDEDETYDADVYRRAPGRRPASRRDAGVPCSSQHFRCGSLRAA